MLAQRNFAVASFLVTLALLVSFGAVKAVLNLIAGRLADRFGRRPLLLIGWLIALPIPFLSIFASSWN